MSRTTLRVSLLATLCLTTPPAHAASRVRVVTNPHVTRAQSVAAAKQSGDPRVSEEGDAARAEEFYERGEALAKKGDTRGALVPLREAVKLYARIYLGGRAPTPPPAPASPAGFRAEMAARLRHAPECIQLYTRLGGGDGASAFERSQLEALRGHAAGIVESDPSRAVFFMSETDARAVITRKPEPRYPQGARGRRALATVRLRVVLGADGVVRDALVMSGQPDFSEAGVEAAKGVKFKPAAKDGRAVSQFVTLEYAFSTY
jgi:TonB family protein